ncbi:3906_t:CDS:2 [Diversispora eburnea]|uniref:3906_t:CDS:1 n=1 Tax=Diversispora eburnea TaxID=1213867 RepID=A0A9N8ZRY4_9GLOM|nr:3906_t:CDS:2 [Diversispora eburnea]
MDNTHFIENESLHQTVLIREQDDQLDSLYGTAREHVERSHGRLESVKNKVTWILQHNEAA